MRNPNLTRAIRWTVALGASAGVLLWSCRGRDVAPADRSVPAEHQPAISFEPGAELEWGGWHVVRFDPEVSSFLTQAYRLQLEGESVEAIAVLNTGLGEAPGSACLLEARGALYASLGYRRAAQRDFEQTLVLDPNRADTWTALARMRHELGLERAALEACDEAHLRGGDDAGLHLTRARILRRLDRPGSAAVHYQAALERTSRPSLELSVEAASLYQELVHVPPEILDRALMATELPEPGEGHEPEVWLVQDLMRELEGMDHERVASGLSALEVQPESVALWTEISLRTVRLVDPETRAGVDGRPMALGQGR